MKLEAVSTEQLNHLPDEAALFLCSCGYESRATAIAKEYKGLAHRSLAVGFDRQRELNYDMNRSWFTSRGFSVADVNDDQFGQLLRDELKDVASKVGEASIVLDVSCMNRTRLAHCVNEIFALNCRGLDVAFAYNLAQYSPPAEDIGPTTVVEPVLPQFAGWATAPEQPPAALLGLGYEENRAIGIVDHLEINNALWAFVPRSPVNEYADAVDQANSTLFGLLSPGRTILYDVMNPANLFRELNSLVDMLKQTFNPILIPFGPKIFALVALLVARQHEQAGVWRVSGGTMQTPSDRLQSPFSTVLRVKLVGE